MLKNLAVSVVILGAIGLLSSVSLADQVDIKILSDSAAALQTSNPDLAANLTKFAKEEADEIEGRDEGQQESEEEAEENLEKHHKEFIKLLRDSASALQKSHPELAEELTKMADDNAEGIEGIEGKEDTKDVEKNEMNDNK